MCAARRVALLLPFALAHCGGADLLFAGEVTPQAGVCDPPSRGTLTLRHTAVQFAPTSGVLSLNGERSADGALVATLTRPGAAHTPLTLRLQAQQSGETISGTYITPRCRYRVALIAVH